MKKFFLTVGILMNSLVSMALSIVTVEQPEFRKVLQTPSALVTFPLSDEDRMLIKAMKEKLYALEGVGLAAPQVNQSKQIIAVYIPESAALLRDNVRSYPMHVLINPSYKGMTTSPINYDFEGCYSVNSRAGKVPRYEELMLSYFDEQGTNHQSIEKGFYARVLQHEIDHINGLLILDRLTPECTQGTPAEMATLRRAELSEEKRILFDSLMEKKRNPEK